MTQKINTEQIMSREFMFAGAAIKKHLLDFDFDNLAHDCGDIKRLINYFPSHLNYQDTGRDLPFDGNLENYNWGW